MTLKCGSKTLSCSIYKYKNCVIKNIYNTSCENAFCCAEQSGKHYVCDTAVPYCDGADQVSTQKVVHRQSVVAQDPHKTDMNIYSQLHTLERFCSIQLFMLSSYPHQKTH